MEVKELDAIGEDEEEEEYPNNMSNHHRDKEVMVVTQVILEEFIHFHYSTTGKFKISGDVTDLGGENAIDCPGNW